VAITLSREHTDYRWVAYAEAARLLRWDSNRTALWELNERLTRQAAALGGRIREWGRPRQRASAIAKGLGIGRASVYRVLDAAAA
jgi:broad specificity phosphatase PhoE